MRLLIIEDDKKIASSIADGMKQAGFSIDHASNGEEGLRLDAGDLIGFTGGRINKILEKTETLIMGDALSDPISHL